MHTYVSSGGGGECPGGLLGSSVHEEGAAFGVLQLQPAGGQLWYLMAEQRPCAAQAAGWAACNYVSVTSVMTTPGKTPLEQALIGLQYNMLAHACGSNIYGTAAVDTQGSQSTHPLNSVKLDDTQQIKTTSAL